MGKKLPRIKGTYSDPLAQVTDGKSRLDIDMQVAEVDESGMDEQGHVIVVTQHGLAMLVAGLRAIAHESPEVEGLLKTLEDALREGFFERTKNGSSQSDVS